MSNTDISIIMATKNAAGDLPGALGSLQTYAPHAPLFIWDGESEDGTLEILKKQNRQITRWESGPDRGIYDAFQKALEWVETPFVYFMGADDRLRKEWTEMTSIVSNTNTVYYGDVWLATGNKRYNGAFSEMDLARTNICQQAIIYPKQIFNRHPYCLEYQMQADWEVNMWCHFQPDINLCYVDACVCDFNNLTGYSSTGYDQAFNRDYPCLLKKYFPLKAFLKYGLVAELAHHTRKLRGKA